MNYQSAISADSVETLSSQGWLLLSLSHQSQEVIGKTYSVAAAFFRSSLDEKNSSRLPEDIGYRPEGIEYSQSPGHPDPIESFTADLRTCDAILSLPSVGARNLYEQMQATIGVLEPLAESLIQQLAKKFSGRDCAHLVGGSRRWSCLQVNYSRPAETRSSFIHEEHEDGHLLTILSANQPGLEIEVTRNLFEPIHPSSEQVLVMPGEILWLLTGGRIKPLYHRVRPHADHFDRMALLFFVDIDPTLCEPWVRSELNEGVDIGDRVLTNALRFGLDPYRQE